MYIYICLFVFQSCCFASAQKFIELGPYDEKSAALIDKVAGLIAWSIPMIEATNAMRHNFRLVTRINPRVAAEGHCLQHACAGNCLIIE